MKNIFRAILCAPLLFAPLYPDTFSNQTAQLYAAYHHDIGEGGGQVADTPNDVANELLNKYHLAKPLHNPFTYEWLTEVYNDRMGQSQPLHSTLEKVSREQYAYLDNAFFYKDTRSLLRDPKKVRKYQLQKKRHLKEKSSLVQATTEDGQIINGTWLNRGSSKLIVVGTGFTNTRETMAPFGDLFHEYDVLFFDFRGHGIDRGKGWIKYFAGVEAGTVSFGKNEHLDVKAIVQKVKDLKEYDEVTALGLCYSALMFNKTASLFPDLFTRLILDGCWESLYYTTQELAKDIGKLAAPQRHSSFRKNRFMQNRYVQKGLLKLAQIILKTEFNSISALDYTSNLPDIPVLFIYGKDDALIPRKQFERVWHATNAPRKTAVITSAPHVWNHLHIKEVYKEICTLFIENSYADFTQLITSPDAYMAYKAEQLQSVAGERFSSYTGSYHDPYAG